MFFTFFKGLYFFQLNYIKELFKVLWFVHHIKFKPKKVLISPLGTY